jgi:hypothetical protein
VEWRISSLILDLGTRWRWVVSVTFLPSPQFLSRGRSRKKIMSAPKAYLDAEDKRKR